MFPISAIRLGYIALTASAVAVVSWLTSAVIMSQFEMSIDTETPVVAIDEPVLVAVTVQSDEPTNVFSGAIKYDPNFFEVVSIDYNTSIADIWAIEPWYSEGDGTITFAGGTTRRDGYTGVGSLLTVTFRAVQDGETSLGLADVQMLRHDGLGSKVEAAMPLDVVFTIEPSVLDSETRLRRSYAGPNVTVLADAPNVDLNENGVQTAANFSIFMLHLTTQNLRSDFNKDGSVSLADLSILTRYR